MRAMFLFVIVAAATSLAWQPNMQAQSGAWTGGIEQDTMRTLLEVNRLINEDREANGAAIRYLSTYLSKSQRAALMSSHEESAGAPFVVNLFIGFGVGSYIQGNITSGLIGTLTQGVGGYLFLTSDSNRDEELYYIGAVVFLAGRVIDMIAPWTYASGRNASLGRNLRGLSLTTSIGQLYQHPSSMQLYPRVGISARL